MPKVLKVLICGGGCAGPFLAFWLARAGHDVTVVERYPALRASGAQIDLRAQGVQVVKRMGLLGIIRSKLVDETGVAFVDSQNRTWAKIMANTSGQGAQSLTSEYEIMRGDLVRILYDATKNNVNYIFGITVESFEQSPDSVIAHFSNGTSDTFDILVGADGQGSRIRKAMLPTNSPDPLHHLGLYTAYWTVPREPQDTNLRKQYISPRRWVMCRSGSSGNHTHETQAYFMLCEDSAQLRSIPRASVETQKEFWTSKFTGIGGPHTDRFIKGMQTTDNFYCQAIAQVKTNTWSQGRVVLLADAAHCPSPISGMGTTSAFVGAYVLAGEICRAINANEANASGNANDDITQAFENYDRVLRPFVNEIQNVPVFMFKFAFPATKVGVALIYWFAWMITLLRVPDLVARFSREEKGGWKLPEYSELDATVVEVDDGDTKEGE